MNARKRAGPLVDALHIIAAVALVAGAVALVVMFPWLLLVAFASSLFMGVRTR